GSTTRSASRLPARGSPTPRRRRPPGASRLPSWFWSWVMLLSGMAGDGVGDDPMRRHRLGLAAQGDLADSPSGHAAVQALPGGVAGDDDGRLAGPADLAGMGLKSAGGIHGVADHRVLHALGDADAAGQHRAGVQSDADVD